MIRERGRPGLVNRSGGGSPPVPDFYFTDDAKANPYFTDDAKANRFVTKGGVKPQLRVAEINGRTMNGSFSTTAAYNSIVYRWPIVLGADMKDLVVSLNNWYADYNGGNPIEALPGNGFTIRKMSIQGPKGTVVPVTFDGGSRLKVVGDGAVDVQSDPILPSSFGLTTFPKMQLFWIKYDVDYGGVSKNFPYQQEISTIHYGGSQVGLYNTASTTPSDTDLPGMYSATGTAFNNYSAGAKAFVLLGHPVVDDIFYLGLGDSIMSGQGGVGASVVTGVGFFNRAIGLMGSNVRPALNMALGGGTFQLYNNYTRWKSYLPYVNRVIDETGTNDIISGASLATVQSRFNTLVGILNGAGLTNITRTSIICRTTSTDSFATLANQTPVTGHGPGGVRDQFNTWLQTLVGTSITAYVDTATPVADAGEPSKWKVNGTPGYPTTDGAHPTSTFHQLMAAPLSAALGLSVGGIAVTAVDDLILWLDAADAATITQSGGAVSQWNDKSGLGKNATQGTGANQPATGTRTVNGLNALDFDGVNDFMALPNNAIPFGPVAAVIVHLPDVTSPAGYLFGNNGSGAAFTRCRAVNQGVDFGDSELDRVSPTSGSVLIQGVTSAGDPSSYERMSFNGGTTTDKFIYRADYTSLAPVFAIGAYGGGTAGSFYNGAICEMATFTRELSPVELTALSAGLNAKWAAY